LYRKLCDCHAASGSARITAPAIAYATHAGIRPVSVAAATISGDGVSPALGFRSAGWVVTGRRIDRANLHQFAGIGLQPPEEARQRLDVK